MWYCNNCETEFKEPEKKITTFEDEYGISYLFPTLHKLEILICPCCRQNNIEEMKICDVCGEYCLEDDLEDTTEAVNGGVGYACSQCIQDCDIKFI